MPIADVYTRLSQLRDGDEGASLDRQAADCRKLAEIRGAAIGAVHRDADLSAFKSDVVRPGYDELRRRMESGAVTEVIFWKIDRVARNTREFLSFVDLAERHGVALVSVNEQFDTSTPIGRVVVTLLAAFAELESATISLRVRGSRAQDVATGRAHFGGRRKFGYTRDMEVIPFEAELIVTAAADLLTGSTGYSVARRWNEAGIERASAGGPWSAGEVTRLLRQPHLAGLRQHKERDGSVTLTEGTWPAILDRSTHEALVAAKGRQPVTRRTSFLTGGVLRCGKCGAKLSLHRSRGLKQYACQTNPGRQGCGGITISADKVDEIVRDVVLTALRQPASRAAVSRDGEDQSQSESDILDELRRVEGEMVKLGESYESVNRTIFEAAAAKLQRQADELTRQLGALADHGVLISAGEDPEVEWNRRDVEWRSKLVAAIFERIDVMPARARGIPFDPERLVFTRAT